MNAQRSSPAFIGRSVETRISSLSTAPVPSIFAPRSVIPSLSSSHTETVRSALPPSLRDFERSPCGSMMT